MWTRKLLKDNARIVLQRRFSILLLAVIIEQLITGITAELSGRTLLFRLNDTRFILRPAGISPGYWPLLCFV